MLPVGSCANRLFVRCFLLLFLVVIYSAQSKFPFALFYVVYPCHCRDYVCMYPYHVSTQQDSIPLVKGCHVSLAS